MSDLFLHWEDPATRSPRSRVVSDSLRIGSMEGLADVRISASGVNAVHAELRVRPDGSCEIVGMGSSRIVSDDVTVSRCDVGPGSVVQLGSLTLRFASTATLRPSVTPGPAAGGSRPRSGGPPASSDGSKRTVVIVATVAAAVLATTAPIFLLARKVGAPPTAPPTPAPTAAPAATPAAAAAPAPAPAPTPTRTAAPAPSGADTFAQARKSVVTVIAKSSFEKGFSTGTGFFVDSRGRVVTNYHVVRQTDYQQILLDGNKQPVDAHIVSKDVDADLVLLQTYVTPPVPVAPMIPSSTELRMGDTVYALGSPAGPELAVSLSRGIVSSDRPRTFAGRNYLQHDAAVNPGNSGGPLLNSRGEVVGLNTAKVKGAEGISFAIPIEDVRRFIEVAP